MPESPMRDPAGQGAVDRARDRGRGADQGDAVDPLEAYAPRTELGRKLMELRARIVASGQPLLSWEELEREVAERRGGSDG